MDLYVRLLFPSNHAAVPAGKKTIIFISYKKKKTKTTTTMMMMMMMIWPGTLYFWAKVLTGSAIGLSFDTIFTGILLRRPVVVITRL